MVLDWFGRRERASVSELVAKKKYAKAVELIRGELQKRRRDRRLRLQLADVLVAAGRPREAVETLEAPAQARRVADEADLRVLEALTAPDGQGSQGTPIDP